MRFSRGWNRAFRERELLLRVDGRVRYLRLSRRRQMIWAAGALGLGVWLAGSSLGLLYMGSAMTTVERNAEQRAHQVSAVERAGLQQDLVRAEGRLTALSAATARLTRDAEGLEQRLARAGEEKAALAAERTKRDRDLERAEERLAAVSAETAELARRAEEQEQGLALAARDEERFAGERARFHRELTLAEARLAEFSAETAELARRAEGREQSLALAEKDKESLVAERARLERNLARSEGLLADLSAENADSARRAHGLEQRLALVEEDKTALATERAQLEQDLVRSEGRLTELSARTEGMATHAEALDRQLALADRDRETLAAEGARLEQDLAWAEARSAAISAEKVELERTVGDFERGYALALAAEPMLADRIETLDGALEVAVDRVERAESQRDFFEKRAERLEARLDGIAEVQNGVVRRLADTTLQGVGMIEKIVAMTGLNVNELILSLRPDNLGSDQGGPFLPGGYSPHDYEPGDFLPGPYEAENDDPGAELIVDYMSGDFMSGEIVDGDFVIADDPDLEFQVSVFLLDQQMDRWEALQDVIRSVPLSSPLDQYRVSSGFGDRRDPVNGRAAVHLGLDLAATMRTPVMATAPGQVVFAGWLSGHGRVIELDHGNGIRTRYAHLREILVEKGQEVATREKIALLGNSGRSTGPHVHYEVQVNGIPYDPMKFLMAGRNAFKG